ncbi:MAG: BamA/TamA family outer membrane protein [Thermodesulfobacteriota bacterium]
MKVTVLYRIVIVFLFALFLVPDFCFARPEAAVKYSIKRAENPHQEKEVLILPYAFPSDSLGNMIGIGGMTKGYGQKQLLFGATAFASDDNAGGGIAGIWDYKPPWFNRIYLSCMLSSGHYPRMKAYTKVNRTGQENEAGGNDSDKNDYIEDPGRDTWFDFKLEYVLPIGSMKDKTYAEYHLKNGLLVKGASGGDYWNPFETGVTVMMIKQFNRYQSYDTSSGVVEGTIHPVEIGILYDNTDFSVNPSKGSSQYIGITNDNGWLDSEQGWTFIEFEASKYFDLGETRHARQQVLAFNFWTGDSLSYEIRSDSSGNDYVFKKPPFLEGARLGGFYRMRAYPIDRFNDRSVIYSTMEYRYTPRWNPIADISLLKFLKMDWFQVVGYIEGGRVANEYTVEKMFSNWKMDVGIGIRAMVAGGVVRFDVATSDESTTTWVMFGHPF